MCKSIFNIFRSLSVTAGAAASVAVAEDIVDGRLRGRRFSLRCALCVLYVVGRLLYVVVVNVRHDMTTDGFLQFARFFTFRVHVARAAPCLSYHLALPSPTLLVYIDKLMLQKRQPATSSTSMRH